MSINNLIINHIGDLGHSFSDANENAEDLQFDVPAQLDSLPDGREAIVIGDVGRLRDFVHFRGDNPYGFKKTCSVVACEGVLRQFDVSADEANLLEHALINGLCAIGGDGPSVCGAITMDSQVRLLNDFGVPSHVEFLGSAEQLAALVENGHGVITILNAGVLWNDVSSFDFGQVNHAVVTIGVTRDLDIGRLMGFYINDSGRDGVDGAAKFTDVTVMEQAWAENGGLSVVTEMVTQNLNLNNQ